MSFPATLNMVPGSKKGLNINRRNEECHDAGGIRKKEEKVFTVLQRGGGIIYALTLHWFHGFFKEKS